MPSFQMLRSGNVKFYLTHKNGTLSVCMTGTSEKFLSGAIKITYVCRRDATCSSALWISHCKARMHTFLSYVLLCCCSWSSNKRPVLIHFRDFRRILPSFFLSVLLSHVNRHQTQKHIASADFAFCHLVLQTSSTCQSHIWPAAAKQCNNSLPDPASLNFAKYNFETFFEVLNDV